LPGLAVTSLALAQFRSHRKLALSVDGRPVAIFGPNGAGKTNLLEAVSLLSPGRGLRRAAPEEIGRRAAGVGWRVTAGIESHGTAHEVETGAEQGGARWVRIDGKAAPQVALGRLARVVWLVPAMDRLWTEAAEGRRRFLDRMTMSFEPAHGEAVLAYEKAMRERNRLLKDEVRDPAWFGALEGRMAEAGARIVAHRAEAMARLEAAQAGAATAFPAATLGIAGPDGAEAPTTEGALAEAFAAGRARDMAAGRTLVGPHRTDLTAIYAAKGVPAAQCSTGEQKALLLSLVLANARALAQDFGAPPLLLLDEVAAHLDADRRAALYDEACALGAQAWLTGTGRDLFQGLEGRAQFLSVAEAGGESAVEVEP
jgi:DNA replication and repair protein RecF